MKFAREGYIICWPFAAVAIAGCAWAAVRGGATGWLVGAIAAALGCAILMFFRDPDRAVPSGEGLVVAPADGRILSVSQMDDGRKHVAIFLSVFNVHVNRTPVRGKATRVARTSGTYSHAGRPGAATNARVDVEAVTSAGVVTWRQVSGWIARKISCRLKPGDEFELGERFGLIFFGSRMDVMLPESAGFVVSRGQKVIAGETVIAHLPREKDSE